MAQLTLLEEPAEYTWRAGDDPRDVWLVTDAAQLATIALPPANKLPCEAKPVAIRAFLKRGLTIPRLGLAWWLSFNLGLAPDVTDIITVEQALAVGIKARNMQLLILLGEDADLTLHKRELFDWFIESATKALEQKASDKQVDAALALGDLLLDLGWIKRT